MFCATTENNQNVSTFDFNNLCYGWIGPIAALI